MAVTARLFGGPHDGAEVQIAAPFPLALVGRQAGMVTVYLYAGFQDGVACYSVMVMNRQTQAA